MSNFTPTRDRDAWFVIRGYKYQVDHSILKWLTLTDDQELILETGEDIDIVNRGLSKGPEELDRTLEQVKHLATRFTLRSPPAKIAIANAVQHLASNPTLKLLFRFCTNASITTERPSPFDDRIPAINIWEKLRNKQLSEPQRSSRLEKLLALIRDFKRPEDGVDSSTWNTFKSFANSSTTETLDGFIASFEWSAQQLNADEVGTEIQRTLHTGLNIAQEQAESIYPRLFLHVMHLLTQKGKKTLTKETLQPLLRVSPLSETDASLLRFLNCTVLQHAARLEQLEAKSRMNEQAIDALRDKLTEIAFGPAWSMNLSAAIAEVSTRLPSQIRPIAQRVPVICDIKKRLLSHQWLAVYGSIGCGKTQLAALLGEQFQSIVYVSLRDLTSNEANFFLNHLFLQLCNNKRTGSITLSGLMALEVGTVLIFDDLPRVTSGDQLSQRLVRIADEVKPRNQRLLTLSHHPIPSRVLESLDPDCFDEIVSPRLNRDDVLDLLRQCGASESVLSVKNADGFLNSSLGNPTLLMARIRALQAREWDSVDEHISVGTRIGLTEEVIAETTFRLMSTVEDTNSRELLYRLCIVIGTFGTVEVNLVSQVSPNLQRSNEAYATLQGLWIEKQSDDCSVVCPLLAASGVKQLTSSVEYGVANALADAIFEKKKLSPIEFARAVQYLKRAKNGVSLGMAIMGALESMSDLPLGWKRLILNTTLAEGLLESCPTQLSLLVRAKQIQSAASIGAPVTQIITAGRLLVGASGKKDMWAVVSYAMLATSHVAKEDFGEAVKLCGLILTQFPAVVKFRNRIKDQTKSDIRLIKRVERSFVWYIAHEIKTAADFVKWFSLISSQPVARTKAIWKSDLARNGMRVALDSLWMRQHTLGESDRDFQPILKSYDLANAYFSQNHYRILHAFVIRAQIIVHAEYLHDLTKAVEIAETFLNKTDNDDTTSFIIHACVGGQYLYSGQRPEAVRKLSLACSLNARGYDGLRCRALIELSGAIGDTDCDQSLHYATEAVEVAKCNCRDVAELDMVSSCGEAALAAWFAGKRSIAFEFLDEAFSVMSRSFEETVDWKMRHVLLGLSLGYMSSIAATGKPPIDTYTVPRRGKLISYDEAIAGWYDINGNGRVDLSPTLLVAFAIAVGKEDRAIYWANKGIDDARNRGILACIYSLGEVLTSQMLRQGDNDQALDYAYESSMSLIGSMVAHRNGDTDVREKGDPIAILKAKPNSDWEEVERMYIWMGIIPTLVASCISGDPSYKLSLLSIHCQAKAKDASNPARFLAFAKSIDLFNSRTSSVDLHNIAIAEGRAGNMAGACANYLLSSFAHDAVLGRAVIQHALVLRENTVQCSGESTIWRCTADQIASHWIAVFDARRFSFVNPREVATKLEETRTMPSSKRVKSTIQAIMTGLNLSLPKELGMTLDWLRT